MRRIAAVAALTLFLPGTGPAQVVVNAPDNANGTDISQQSNFTPPAPPAAGPGGHVCNDAAAGPNLANRLTVTPVPEPTTLVLSAVGMLGMGAIARLRWASRWRKELDQDG